MRNIAILVSALVCCAPAFAQVYKWVDAGGVTHYGEAPPEGVKAKEVKLREAAPPGGNAQAKPGDSDLKDKERAYKQRQAEREKTAAQAEKDKALREEQCKRAGAQLADLRSHPRTYQLNDKGEREFLPDDQRDALLASREQEYNQHCN